MKLAFAHADRLVREALRRTLARSGHDLLWMAADRLEMETQCRRRPPQLLLAGLDLLGAKAERLPALLAGGIAVIALTTPDEVGDAYEALGFGALGLVEPPRLADSGELIGGARTLARIERLASLVGAHAPAGATTAAGGGRPPIVALGASTGGPHALARVLATLPADLPAAVVIVQHIESAFTHGLAEWLASQSPLPVAVAERGGEPQPGRVYVAGAGGHLVLLPSFQFGSQAARSGELHVPSVDALFLSLGQHAGAGAAALLTGMGSDGVAGLGELRRRGWCTLAQDEGSSVVYGMPRAALESGAAAQSLDLAAIGPALVRHITRGKA